MSFAGWAICVFPDPKCGSCQRIAEACVCESSSARRRNRGLAGEQPRPLRQRDCNGSGHRPGCEHGQGGWLAGLFSGGKSKSRSKSRTRRRAPARRRRTTRRRR